MNVIIEKVKSIHASTYFYLLVGMTIPLQKNLINNLLICAGILAILYSIKNKKIISLTKQSLILIIFYLMLWLFNFINGINKINIEDNILKSALLYVPLIFTLIPSKNHLYFLAKGLIIGCFLNIIISYVYVLINHPFSVQYFIYGYSSLFHHTSYTAIYYLLAIYFLLEHGILKYNIIKLLFIIFFSLYLFMLFSKAGWLALILLYIYYGIKNLKWHYASMVTAIIILCTYFILKIPVVKDKIGFAYIKTNNHFEEESSTGIRVLIWQNTWNIIKEKPLGFGKNKSINLLQASYKRNNMPIAFDKKLNCHNTFLQLILSTGLIGFFYFAFLLFFPFYYKRNRTNYVYFLIVFVFMLISESIFETQDGVLIFTLSYLLFSGNEVRFINLSIKNT